MDAENGRLLAATFPNIILRGPITPSTTFLILDCILSTFFHGSIFHGYIGLSSDATQQEIYNNALGVVKSKEEAVGSKG
jgi:hypothetical protein